MFIALLICAITLVSTSVVIGKITLVLSHVMALEQNPKAFWIHHQRANALAKLGKKEEAKTAANKSIELAKEAKNDDYVKLNEKLLADMK